MAHLIKIMQLIQNVSGENPEVDAALKDIVRLYEENDALKNEKAQLDTDFNNLQKEFHNMENMVGNYSPPIESQLHVVQGLKLKINELDLDKMVLYDVMKLEKEYGDDWQLYKDLTEEHLKQQARLRQRDIVKEYYIVEEIVKNTRRMFEEIQTSINGKIKLSQKERREHDNQINKLIVEVIKCAKKLEQQQNELNQLKLMKAEAKKLKQLKEEEKPYKAAIEDITDFPIKELTRFPTLMDLIRKDVNSIPQILTYIDDELDNDAMKKSVQFKEPLTVVKTFNITNNANDSDVISESSGDNPLSPSNQNQKQKIDCCVVIEETDEEQDLEVGNVPSLLPLASNNTENGINGNSNNNDIIIANNVTKREMINLRKSPIEIQECLVIKPTTTNFNINNDNNDNSSSINETNERDNFAPTPLHLVEPDITTTAAEPTRKATHLTEKRAKNLSAKSFHDDFEQYLSEFRPFFSANNAEEPSGNNEQEPGESLPLVCDENAAAVADMCTDNNFFSFDDFDDDNNNNNNNDNNYLL